jgi:uncharacterized protein YdaU (DUF1376 family)
MNYYEHHIGDYARATAHLSMLEDCAYTRLLRWYYADERPIPADLKVVCRVLRATTKPERDAVQTVLSEFFVLEDDGYHQKRADDEIARYQEKQRKAKASANARWNAQKAQTEGNANAHANALQTDMRTHSERNAEAMLTRHQTPDPIQNPEAESEGKARPEDPEKPPTAALTGVVSSFQRPLPDGWQPSAETVARVIRARPDLAGRVPAIAEDFRLYLATQTGIKALSADWESSFVRWASKERETVKRNASARLPGGFVC